MGNMTRRHVESRGRFSWLLWAACHKCSNCCGKDANLPSNDESDGDEEEGEDENPQYTLESRRFTAHKSMLPFLSFRQKCCHCCSRSTMTSDEDHPDLGQVKRCLFLDVNRIISRYLSWCFRTSYFLLFTAFTSFYYLQVVIYAVLYYVISLRYPACINSGGSMIGDGVEAHIFADCFHLSWSTFATVGYGVIFPSTGASSFEVPVSCVAMGVLGSFEAFLGVLYAGFCGAILFGKVLRSQNNAQVFFSDPIVVRFGKEELSGGSSGYITQSKKVTGDEEMGAGKSSDSLIMKGSEDDDDNDIPCPMMEFRLVNRLHGTPSGEIVEAKLDCVAILDPKVAKAQKDMNKEEADKSVDQLEVDENTTMGEMVSALADTKTAVRGIAFHSTDSKKPHMFTKISLDADEHPYFRRVWFGRHRLDENSPLLTPAARKRVKLNGGFWPKDMNNCKSIKNSIHFRHILVCINGTSNANAASVYARKVYDRVDVTVGYRFVPMIHHTDDGELKTDPYLLNVVYPQRGGGAEDVTGAPSQNSSERSKVH